MNLVAFSEKSPNYRINLAGLCGLWTAIQEISWQMLLASEPTLAVADAASIRTDVSSVGHGTECRATLFAKPNGFDQVERSRRACAGEDFACRATGSSPSGYCQSSNPIVHMGFGRRKLSGVTSDAGDFFFDRLTDINGYLIFKTNDGGRFELQPKVQLPFDGMNRQPFKHNIPFG